MEGSCCPELPAECSEEMEEGRREACPPELPAECADSPEEDEPRACGGAMVIALARYALRRSFRFRPRRRANPKPEEEGEIRGPVEEDAPRDPVPANLSTPICTASRLARPYYTVWTTRLPLAADNTRIRAYRSSGLRNSVVTYLVSLEPIAPPPWGGMFKHPGRQRLLGGAKELHSMSPQTLLDHRRDGRENHCSVVADKARGEPPPAVARSCRERGT